MGGALFPPCYLTWGQSMVEVMKIRSNSFIRLHAHTAAHNAPIPEAGHSWSMPPLGTPGHSWASLSLLISPGSWCTQGFVCALQESVSQTLGSSGGCVVELMGTSSKMAYAIPRSSTHRTPALASVHCWPIPPYIMYYIIHDAIHRKFWSATRKLPELINKFDSFRTQSEYIEICCISIH